MKLITLDDGSRDGQLAVVSRDLASAHFAAGIAGRMQQLLDDWNFISPQLEDLYAALNDGKARHAFAFDPARCRAPLPRAYQWLSVADGSGAGAGALSWVRHPGDDLPGPRQRLPAAGTAGTAGTDGADGGDGIEGVTVGLGIAAVTSDVARRATTEAGLDAVRLLLLFSEAEGLDARATAFAPVAVTPDELGTAWRGGRVALDAAARIGRRRLAARPPADTPPPHLGELIAAAATSHRLGAGSVVGCALRRWDPAHTGTESAPGRKLQPGDTLQIDMADADVAPLFGTIEWHWQRSTAMAADVGDTLINAPISDADPDPDPDAATAAVS
ncbi:MAG: fumarylacetoacetate hydrolase [Rubrivivax sp.]